MNEIITPDGKVFVPVYTWNKDNDFGEWRGVGERTEVEKVGGEMIATRLDNSTTGYIVTSEWTLEEYWSLMMVVKSPNNTILEGRFIQRRRDTDTNFIDSLTTTQLTAQFQTVLTPVRWQESGFKMSWLDIGKKEGDVVVFSSMMLGKLYNQVETITFPKSTYTLKPDQSLQLYPDILPADSYDKTLIWQTTDPSVATVIEGKVFAVDQGSCEIIAESVNGKVGTCTIKVERVPITSIEFESDRIEIGINEIADLEYTIRPADGYSKDLFWASSSDAVRVRNGVIQGARAGSATVSVTSYNGVTGSIEVVVSLKPKSAIVPKTIQSQYANSPNLLTIINEMASAFNHEVDIEKFKKYIWNVETANGHGLDIWGRIVGVNRNVQVASAEGNFFGFTDGFSPFDVDPFTGQGTEFGGYKLNDTAFRELIMIKAFANIVYATAPNINRFLKFIFKGRGNAFFLITGHMTARYTFDFVLSDFERKIIYELDLLPRPCGVRIDILEEDSANTFGFDGTGYQPFDQGTFA